MRAPDFSIRPLGPFSLEESATFGFGQRSAALYDGCMRLGFCVDGFSRQVGVTVRQDDDGVHSWVDGEADECVRKQVARVLFLDPDGREFVAVGQRDPVIGHLQELAPGLRPPLFYSPCEAAVWSVLSARRSATQMAPIRRRLSEAHGQSFDLAGEQLSALPTPSQLLAVDKFPGIPPRRSYGTFVSPRRHAWRPLRTWAMVLIRAAAGRQVPR